MIGLVCIDVDGTLVGSSGVVTEAVWDAAARARDAGIRLALCSGRPGFGLARQFAERLDPDGWHVFQNGASVMRLPSGETRSTPLPPERVTWLVGRARTLDRPLELYSDTEYAVELDVKRTRMHAELLGVPFRLRNLLSLAPPIVRAQWLVPLADADAVTAEPHDELTITASLSPVMPDTAFLNMTLRGVDKAGAIRTVADAYGVPLSQVMMVGDGLNDLTALQAVGVPVAMGNAEPEVRAAAKHVVGHVDRDGLVEALAIAMQGAA